MPSHIAFRITHPIAIYTHNAIRILHTLSQYTPTMHFALYTHNSIGFVQNLSAARVHGRVCTLDSFSKLTVEHLLHITSEYEERFRRCQYVPRFSFGRRMPRDDGAPNIYFLMYLFCEESIGIQYLKDIGLFWRGPRTILIILTLGLLGVIFLITYHHPLLSIHSSCKFIRTIIIILRLAWCYFLFNNLSPPAHFH